MLTVPETRELIKRILADYAAYKPSYGGIEVETVFDETRDHYEVVHTGWEGWNRVHGALLHVDIRGDKIWIQHDGTEEGIADELMEAGVPQDRIVLAWQHPHTRKLTRFAAA